MGADVSTLPKRVQIEVVNNYEQVLSWLSSILETGREKRIFKGEAKTNAFIIFNNLIAGVLVARLTKATPSK